MFFNVMEFIHYFIKSKNRVHITLFNKFFEAFNTNSLKFSILKLYYLTYKNIYFNFLLYLQRLKLNNQTIMTYLI